MVLRDDAKAIPISPGRFGFEGGHQTMRYSRIAFGVLVLAWGFAALAQPARWQDEVQTRLNNVRERAPVELDADATLDALLAELDALLAGTARVATQRDERLLVDLVATRRLVTLAASAPSDAASDWYAYLSSHDGPGLEIAFLLGPHDRPAGVLGVLSALRDRFGDDAVGRYPALVAALCVVHDAEKPFSRRINENVARSPGPGALFEYFTTNERRLLFGIRDVPAELLVFVVDAVGTIEELRWALERHQGDRAVGRRFFDIAYDHEHARTGRPKAVTQQGFTLPNIAELGGVCADQCHYAVTVGKAIGVPTAYVTGRGGEVGHAWVGYLDVNGRSATWNFEVGRYREYQGVRGVLLDPQSGRRIADDELGLLARLTSVNQRQRYAATAWLDAATALRAGMKPLDIDTGRAGKDPRSGSGGVLELAEMGLRDNPADRRGWTIVREAVADPSMSMRDRVRWSQIVIRLCEEARAEHFMVGMLEPMVASMDDPKERIATWERVLPHVRTKKDLRARIRLIQAADAIGRGDKHGAYLAYADVYENTLNDTRESRHAVAGAVAMLEAAGKHREAAELLSDVLKRVQRPRTAAVFSGASNYAFVRSLAEAYSAKHGVQVAGL